MEVPKKIIPKMEENEPTPNCNLMVCHVPVEWKAQDIQQLFGPYGKIESIKIMYDLKENHSKGYGFVYFSNLNEAKNAKRSLNGLKVGHPGKKSITFKDYLCFCIDEHWKSLTKYLCSFP